VAVKDLLESHRQISAQLRAIKNSPTAPRIDDDDAVTILEISIEVDSVRINEDKASILTTSTTCSCKTAFKWVLRETKVYIYA